MIFGITAILSAKNLGETIGNIRGELTDIVTSQCFVEGTLVVTSEGNKPIEEIQAGDLVYSTNPETGESGYKEVVQTFENETKELVHITVADEEIVSTPKHPFYVPQKGWTSAVDLKSGDMLVLSNGEYVIIEKVQHEILETPVKVYNFEVQDLHTYYVGKNSVLVHNKCNDSKKSINYKPRDLLGRATGIEATITQDMIKTGTRTSTKVNPVGFGGQVSGHARGHLLGKQLGGSGTNKKNLVTIFQNPVNTPVMSGIESRVRKAVESGQTVYYKVTPIYIGNNLIPSGITIEATGTGSSAINIFQTILNRK